MSMTSNGESIGRIGDEPTGEVKYLSDGATLRGKIAGSRRENVIAAGERFLAATGGATGPVLCGAPVSQPGHDHHSPETSVARSCTAPFWFPGQAFEGTIWPVPG